MEDILLVDGYNIIGAWPELRSLRDKDLESARDILIEKLAEYRAYTGDQVLVVFDAHMVPGLEKKRDTHKVKVIFTKENETADECIEKLASELNNIKTQIHVATSDFTEQWVIFGQGALRKSARELRNEVIEIEGEIKKNVDIIREKKPISRITLSDQVSEVFEKWRRGEK